MRTVVMHVIATHEYPKPLTGAGAGFLQPLPSMDLSTSAFCYFSILSTAKYRILSTRELIESLLPTLAKIMQSFILIAISTCILGKVSTISAQTCFFPNGDVASRDRPCRASSSDQASACCAYMDVCLDNNLCLAQQGNEVVSRGSCTDQSWQSGACPQYCQDGKFSHPLFQVQGSSCRHAPYCFDYDLYKTDLRSKFCVIVNPNLGASIYPFQNDTSFCCGPGNSSTNTCFRATRGSYTPFHVEAGRVIFNRTSGSTSPNSSDIVTVTVTTSGTALPYSSIVTVTVTSTAAPSTIAATLSNLTACHDSSSSSNKSIAIGVGASLGLALLSVLVLMWRQRTRELGARKEVRTWEQKYDELKKEKRRDFIGSEGQIHELGYESWRPDEIDGRPIHEMAGVTR